MFIRIYILLTDLMYYIHAYVYEFLYTYMYVGIFKTKLQDYVDMNMYVYIFIRKFICIYTLI
jgi:hypothetical protein